jgi:hypothetical protein
MECVVLNAAWNRLPLCCLISGVRHFICHHLEDKAIHLYFLPWRASEKFIQRPRTIITGHADIATIMAKKSASIANSTVLSAAR